MRTDVDKALHQVKRGRRAVRDRVLYLPLEYGRRNGKTTTMERMRRQGWQT